MLGLAIHFPTAHYAPRAQAAHVATWPPSPWHVLAALATVWQDGPARKHNIPRDAVAAIVDALAGESPLIALPRGARTGPQTVTLSDDTTVWLVWRDVDLDLEALGHLSNIAQHLHWLGQPDNWIELTLATDPDAIPRHRWLVPTAEPPHPDRTSQLLLPLPPPAWARWRERYRDTRFAALLESIGHRAAIYPPADPAGNKSETARALGMARTTLISKLHKHGLA